MSLFVVVRNGCSEKEQRFDELIQDFERILGSAFEIPKLISLDQDTLLICCNLKGSANPIQVKKSQDRWHVLSGQVDSNAFDKELNFYNGAGMPSFFQPVWGRYTAVVGSAVFDTIYGWQTTPCLESVCYAQCDNSLVISNNPLLCKLTLESCKGINIIPHYDENAIDDYLSFGYTVGKTTMYEGVSQVLPRHIVKLVNYLDPVQSVGPVGLSHSLPVNHTLEDAAEALESALSSAFQRAAIDNKLIDMRVSGGKDSRLMLGLAKKFGALVTATCVGDGSDWDSRIAAKLTKQAGFDFISRGSPFYDDDPWMSTIRSLRATLGVPQSEAHFTPYEFTDPKFAGQTLMFGNWPAYHGVYHRKMGYTNEEVRTVAHGIVSNYVSSTIRERQIEHLNDYLNALTTPTIVHKLYEFGLVYRGSNWMKSAFSGYSSKFNCAFFMSDQECTSLADRLTMFEHISYAPEFLTLKNIWPEAARTPLANNMWRFEVNSPSANSLLDPQGYKDRLFDEKKLDQRYPKINTSSVNPRTSPYAPDTILILMKYLYSSSTYHAHLANRIGEKMRLIIEHRNPMILDVEKVFLWRVFSLTIALSKQWFHEF